MPFSILPKREWYWVLSLKNCWITRLASCQRIASTFDAAMNYLYNRVLTEYLLSAASLSSISFDKIFSIQIKHDKHLVSSVEIGKLKNSMIYFTDVMIHKLLKDLFLARNYILLKQRRSWTEYHNRYYILILSCFIVFDY